MEWDLELARSFTLAGKVAVITGAGSGLGQETARIFARAGATVVLADIDESGLSATLRIIGNASEHALCRRVDVSCREEVEGLADAVVVEKRRLDVWVNGA